MLTRPGLTELCELFFDAGDLRLLLLNGTFNPADAVASQIFPTEVGAERPLLDIVTSQWDTGTNSYRIALSTTFTPTVTATINRLAIVGFKTPDDPNEFGNLDVVSSAAGTFSLALATSHDITVGQVVYFPDGTSATIDTIATTATTDFTHTMTAGETDPVTYSKVYPARARLIGAYAPLDVGSISAGIPITMNLQGNKSSL